MTIVPTGGPWHWPEIQYFAYLNQDLNGTNLRYGWPVRVPRDGNIDRVCFFTGSTAVTTQSIDIRLETFSSGLPSGSLYGGSAAGVLASVAATTNYEVTLATPAAANVGDEIWVVFQWTGTAGVVAIAAADTGILSGYRALYTSSWAKGVNTRGMLALRYDDGLYYPTHLMGPGVMTFATWANNSTPDERGIKASLPFGMEVDGFWVHVDADAACDLVLYDSANNVLATCTVDPNNRGSTSETYCEFRFDPMTLAAGDYRLIMKPTTTSTIRTRIASLFAANVRGAWPGGTNICGTSRTDAGSWTDDTAALYPIGFCVSGIDIPAGGGMIGGGNLRGGFQ